MNPATTYYVSAPFHYQPDPRRRAWNVSTYSHTYSGAISVQQATLQSDNTVYAQLTLDVGPENVADDGAQTRRAEPARAGASIGLGSNAVSPLDMASAYATLAAGGDLLEADGDPQGDPRERKGGRPRPGWGNPQRKRVISDGVAYTVTKILEQNVLYGTGTRANFGRPAAGKTGTTDDHADAWFCGYLPNLEATVWVGYPQGEIPMENVHGIAVAGGSFPGGDLAAVHGAGDALLAGAGLLLPEDLSELEVVAAGQYDMRLQPTSTSTSTTTTTTPDGPAQ